MKKKPYVGVTGFMSPEEVTNTLKDINFKKTNRLLMVGVLASSKTIQGIKNKWPNRYPQFEEIKNIFQNNEDCLNLVHYNTKEPNHLLGQLVDITEEVGSVLHGFQLNIAWPNVTILEQYKDKYPEKTIVLQIGSHAFDMVENSPEKLADKVWQYVERSTIDYVLLDPSGGLGQPFDPEKTFRYLEALRGQSNRIGLGTAGGLSPTTLHLLKPLLAEFQNISIDAEGKLRTAEDHLDVETTRQYIQGSFKLFEDGVMRTTNINSTYTTGEY